MVLEGIIEPNNLNIEVEIIASGAVGAKGKDGYTPIKGVDYFDGADGYTPIKGVDYFDGKNGKDGKDGLNGKDGYTPIKGIDYFDGKDGTDGRDGKDGSDYIITAADYAEIAAEAAQLVPQYDDTEIRGAVEGLAETKADKSEIPKVPVTDVRINGTSIVADGVANVPAADDSFGTKVAEISISEPVDVIEIEIPTIYFPNGCTRLFIFASISSTNTTQYSFVTGATFNSGISVGQIAWLSGGFLTGRKTTEEILVDIENKIIHTKVSAGGNWQDMSALPYRGSVYGGMDGGPVGKIKKISLKSSNSTAAKWDAGSKVVIYAR